ncbi:hypothetical protein KKF45_05375, partial [Patescibacteria group bacterium]|nr:hypothetical protein [Patescibacteria group bacterium]
MMKARSIRFPKFRMKSELDSFERFLILRTERVIEMGLLFLIILKLLARQPMTGSELRRVISNAGFNLPHLTTLSTHLGVMKG